MQGDLRRWLKIRPAASYMGLSERTLRNLLKNSNLKHSRLPSGTILIGTTAIDEFLAQYEVGPNRVDALVDQVVGEIV